MKTLRNPNRAALVATALLGLGSLGMTSAAQARPAQPARPTIVQRNDHRFDDRFDNNRNQAPRYGDNRWNDNRRNDYRDNERRRDDRFDDRRDDRNGSSGTKKLITGLAIGAIAGIILGR